MKIRFTMMVVAGALCFGALLLQRAHSADAVALSKAPTLEGTWRWNFVMPDGTTNRPRLKFSVEEGRLFGLTSFRAGSEAAVTNLVVNGDHLSFQVMRSRSDRDIVTTYSGKWSDESIVGKIESNWAGGKQTFDWEAVRAHHGVEGIWSWTNSFLGGGGGGRGPGGRGRGFESRIELEQEGEKITGKTVSRSGRSGRGGSSVPITNGVFTNGVIYFEIERTFFETKNLSRHCGKQTGDVIIGTIETEFNGEERVLDWEAKRVD